MGGCTFESEGPIVLTYVGGVCEDSESPIHFCGNSSPPCPDGPDGERLAFKLEPNRLSICVLRTGAMDSILLEPDVHMADGRKHGWESAVPHLRPLVAR